ncbi:hypothetical protein JI721_03020 [Alicyclobacillus cycloheptanicus]|uniref:TraC-like domain-containing protein n=1 Tax=Alicyclobacillus cycloheptanicus TaxID=1457 RepID=A0ABT9XK31_9BACL|nr:hypothetical protein [Alicyclobacillus cycloheptanicus]MCL6453726.1 conjugal transfer protein TraC [Alicyclobacillus sp.]MDQ0190633.1 hypothetical protein [Alicyclobacillus cycloheptanicus]WDM01833.1 hypothetical protein JI721_03020 [Alicyclobacillus cycloheptanicus]
MFGTRNGRDPQETARQHRYKTALEWMPVKDVYEGLIHRKDGQYVAVLEISPINLSLLSEREQEQKVAALHEAINGLRGGFQLLILPHPIDLYGYFRSLENQIREANGIRRSLLVDQLAYVRLIVSGGQAIEWRYYMLVASRDKKDAVEQARELAHSLSGAGLEATLLEDDALIGMLHTWANPSSAAFERPVTTSLTTLSV